jgi:NAD(P)-dependent dehydrogenase (short-subunit alcohol dehydrogenase family)
MKNLQGRTAFITGGASGIGLGMAEAFASAGMRIVIADINADSLEKASADLRSAGATVMPVMLDVTQLDAWASVAERVEAEFGSVDLLCNNAGMGQGRIAYNQHYTLTDISPELWRLLFETNVSSVYHGIKTFAPRMVANGKGGHIVNTSSMAGLLAPPGMAVYAATKFAVLGLSESVRAELQPHGIGVSVLCPGGVQSNLVATSASIRRASEGANAGMHAAMDTAAPSVHVMMLARKVGDRVLKAVLDDELYILTHPEYAPLVTERFDSILSAIGESAQQGYADTPASLQRSRSPIYQELASRLRTNKGTPA